MKAFLAKLSSEFMRVVRLVSAIAVAIGLFFGGVAWQQSTAANDLADSDLRGYKRGLTEATTLHESQDSQTVLIARLLAIVQSPESAAALSPATNDALSDVNEAVKRNDFEAATKLLPPEITYALDSECVKPDGLFTVSIDQRFSVCGSNEIFIVTYIQSGAIDFSINGKKLRIDYAGRESFSENCFVAYERRFKTDEALTAEVRFGCK